MQQKGKEAQGVWTGMLLIPGFDAQRARQADTSEPETKNQLSGHLACNK